MGVPQVRFGNWLKHEEGYSPLDKVLNLDILPQGDSNHPDTKHKDEFYVEVTLVWLDLWLPDKAMWSAERAKHLQMSEYLKLEVFRGNRAECEEVVQQIVNDETTAELAVAVANNKKLMHSNRILRQEIADLQKEKEEAESIMEELRATRRRERDALEMQVESLQRQLAEITERKYGKPLPTKEEARGKPNMVLKYGPKEEAK